MQDLSACLPHSLSLFLCFSLSSSMAVVSVAGTAIWAKPFGPNMHIMSTWPQRFIYNCVET